jgi:hypothetical protein
MACALNLRPTATARVTGVAAREGDLIALGGEHFLASN